MVFFVRITVNQSHLRPICKSTKFNPKIQRTIYLINFQQLRLHVPDFIRTVVKMLLSMASDPDMQYQMNIEDEYISLLEKKDTQILQLDHLIEQSKLKEK